LLNALEFGNAIIRDSLINNTKFIVEDENIIYDDRLIYSESNKNKYDDEDEIENPIEWEGEFYCPECKSILERIEIDHFICDCGYEINNFKGEWIW
jgi:hypothetical protein